MTESLIIYFDRANNQHLVDPNALRHSVGLDPVVSIAIDLIKAGLNGVALDESQISDGRYVQCLNWNITSPEGALIADLLKRQEQGDWLPDSQEVLECIRDLYSQMKAAS